MMPRHEAAASCQKIAIAFILPLRGSGLGKKGPDWASDAKAQLF